MSYTFCDNIEKMQGYIPGFQPGDPRAIKLNTNENPYPPSPMVFEALNRLKPLQLMRYPQVFWDEFRKVASLVHNVDENAIVCGNGCDELLTMLVRCCCDTHRPLAYPVPTYSLYPVLANIQDCPVIEIPFTEDYDIPPRLFEADAKLTILCNPNAPTGTIISVANIAELAGAVNGVLAIDEAYVDFAEENCLPLLKKHDNVVILRTMSKGYSLAGMRFGYAMGAPRIIDAMLKVKDSYNVNAATQAAAVAALGDQEYFRQVVSKIKNERRRLEPALRELGFELGKSHSNFILARIDKPSASQIHRKLAKNNIFIRYFKSEPLSDKIRISVGTPEQNDALLNALAEIFDEA